MNLDKETRSEILMYLYYYFWPLNNDRLNPHKNLIIQRLSLVSLGYLCLRNEDGDGKENGKKPHV